MHINLRWFFTFLLLFIGVAHASDEQKILDIQTWHTSNGVPVYYVYAEQLPMLDIAVIFDAGAARDTKPGVANLTSHLLDKGAGKLDVEQIAVAFEGAGARFAANTDRDMTSVQLRSLTDLKYLEPALKTFTLVLNDPTLGRAAFQLAQKRLMVSLQRQEQQPSSIISKQFYKALYANEPYGHPVSGTIESIKNISIGDLKAFYKKYYVSQNARIVMVGAIKRDQAQIIAEKIVSKMNYGDAAPQLAMATSNKQMSTQHVDFPSEQTHVRIGQVGITRDDPDYFSIIVGNYILGGGGLVSRLFDEVREKRGLVYSVYSHFSPLKQRGPFSIGLQTRNAETDNAIAVVRETLDGFIKNGPDATELEEAKQNLIGAFPIHLASNASILANVSNIAFYQLPLTYLDNYRDNIRAVSAETIKQALQRVIDLDKLTIITVGGSNKQAQRASNEQTISTQ